MYATLLEVGMKLSSDGFKTVSEKYPDFSPRNLEVVCALGQPWFLGSTITETYSKERPFQISTSLIQELQNTGLSKVLQKQESLSWQEVLGTPKLHEVYADVVRIGGYPVQNYLRRSATELSVQFYFGVVSSTVQEHIDEVLKRVLPNHEIFFVTATRAFSILEHTLASNTQQRSVLLEVTGEITSVAILKQGIVTGVVTLPFGTNHILKTLAPDALSAEEARGLLEVVHKKSDTATFETLPSELQEALTNWKDAVVTCLNDLSEGVSPPTNVVIVVHELWYPFYKLSIEKPWEMPGVRILQGNIVHQISVLQSPVEKKSTSSLRDTRLSLLTHVLPSCTQEKGMWYTEK
jgi:hypothetical protein